MGERPKKRRGRRIPPIIVRYSESGRQGLAWFARSEQICYGSNFPGDAARKLLAGCGKAAGQVELDVEDPAVSAGTQSVARWDPPDLLFQCDECGGTGECAGLSDRSKCE